MNISAPFIKRPIATAAKAPVHTRLLDYFCGAL
jgi:hypothetical protein